MKKINLIILAIFFTSNLVWANHPAPTTPQAKSEVKAIETPDHKNNSIPCYIDEEKGLQCEIDGVWKSPSIKEPWGIQQVPIIIRNEIVAYNIFAYNNVTKETVVIAPNVKIVKTQWAKTVRSLGRTGAVFGIIMQAIFWLPVFFV